MKEEGGANPSLNNTEKGDIKNLYIFGEDAKREGEETWSIVIFERGRVREMRA